MGTPYLGEIRVMSFGFVPKGWAACNGQLLPINQNQALFALLGTTYGGDGQVNFALPDLRGRAPVHTGSGVPLGDRGGEAQHTLVSSEMPEHRHVLVASTAAGDSPLPAAHVLARRVDPLYMPPVAATQVLHPGTVAPVGGSQPHDNLQPYLTLNFCIALQGIFPSRD
jgi:microcystin-dependent protein